MRGWSERTNNNMVFGIREICNTLHYVILLLEVIWCDVFVRYVSCDKESFDIKQTKN